MPRILVVEDQPNLRRGIARALEESGFEAVPVETLAQADQILSTPVDLILLDLMLPDGSGLEWLAGLRNQNSRLPVMILTARDAIEDRVAGLDTGANDYLVKPFAYEELLARIRALLRRDHSNSPTSVTFQDLTVDLMERTVRRGSHVLALQNRPLELLVYLMRHANQVVTREMISRDVWKEPTATWTNVIEVHINQLRKKLERPGQPTILHTIRGQGYLLGDPP